MSNYPQERFQRPLRSLGMSQGPRCPLWANSGLHGRPFQNKAVKNAGGQHTRCDDAFAETTDRCAASAMAMPRPLVKQP
jgi:hypothetical protein